MTVYVDGLFYKGSGIGRYYEFLVSGLSKRGINIVTAVPEPLKDSFLRQFSANSMVEPIFVPYEKFALKSFTSQSNLLKSLENKVDWFLYPHVNLPMFVPRNTIVTVHDLIPLTAYWDGSKVKASFFRSLVSRAVRKAYRIIAVSETTRSELVTVFPQSKDKTVVIYESYEERLVRIASTLDKRLVDGSYFLYVGNRKRHKNLGRVIEALSRISDKSIKFVIAGQKDGAGPDEIETQVKELNLGHRVLFFVNPSDELLASLYKGARFLIQPSLIEGFGLPPLEALSLGTPVLLSDIPIFREIYEDAAEYFDPFSVEDIAEQLQQWVQVEGKPEVDWVKVNRVMAKFDRENILNQYMELLQTNWQKEVDL